MPELPEVESARSVIAARALNRRIADVDDRDGYECRPHAPGEIRDALVGRSITDVHRRGKLMWCETSPTGRSSTAGPTVAIHLGMAGRILVSRPSGEIDEGGDYVGGGGRPRSASPRKPEWDRFTITFDDGGALRLFDKRRLGRVYLDPDVDALGPDAGEVRERDFRELTTDQLTDLHRELRKAIRSAIRKGGVHTGVIVEHRTRGGHCPRCGAEMARSTVGGRTTWRCTKEQ